MNRILLPFIALFMVPALVVILTGHILNLPAIQGIVIDLPPASWINAVAMSFGAMPSDPVPILAAATGVAIFTLSSIVYSQVSAVGGDEMFQLQLYGRTASRLFSIILFAFFGTFALTFYYMKLNKQISIFLGILAMIGAYRLVLGIRWPVGQGRGQMTAEEAEAQRGNI